MAEPVSVAYLDRLLGSAHRRRWKAVSALFAVLSTLIVVLGVFVLQNGSYVRTLDQRLASSCSFWKSLGEAPVVTGKPGQTPSRLGVLIVAEARSSYLGQDCGQLSPPSSALRSLAALYHVPLAG